MDHYVFSSTSFARGVLLVVYVDDIIIIDSDFVGMHKLK